MTRRRRSPAWVLLAAVAIAVLATAGTPATAAPSATAALPFRSSIRPLSPALRARMRGRSWHVGCPVPLDRLRDVRVTHRTWVGGSATGEIIVGADVASAVVRVFRSLYALRYPIRRMEPVDAWGGSDFASIEADNTSSFNCRPATGSSHWSQHAYGHAIDLNPIENPYLSNGRSSHPASRPYENRRRHLKGMLHAGDRVVSAFAAIGWGWGGSWSGSIRDTQHFSVTGR